MPTAMFMSTFTGAIAAAGVAFASLTGIDAGGVYDDTAMTKLTSIEAGVNAEHVFARADRNHDTFLDVDEFAALTVITAELAYLNGFIAVEKGAEVGSIALPLNAPAVLSASEHTRIDAVARHTFYAFVGEDGKMQHGEYIALQRAVFSASDLNANGALTRAELSIFAQRQAFLRPEA